MTIKLGKEERAELVERVRAYFEEERSETIGELAAGQLIDFMLLQLSPYAYNRAIADVRVLLGDAFGRLDDELYALERPTGSRR